MSRVGVWNVRAQSLLLERRDLFTKAIEDEAGNDSMKTVEDNSQTTALNRGQATYDLISLDI